MRRLGLYTHRAYTYYNRNPSWWGHILMVRRDQVASWTVRWPPGRPRFSGTTAVAGARPAATCDAKHIGAPKLVSFLVCRFQDFKAGLFSTYHLPKEVENLFRKSLLISFRYVFVWWTLFPQLQSSASHRNHKTFGAKELPWWSSGIDWEMATGGSTCDEFRIAEFKGNQYRYNPNNQMLLW